MNHKWKNFSKLICRDLTFTMAFVGFNVCFVIVLTMALLMHGDPGGKLVSNAMGIFVIFMATVFGVTFWWWMSFKCTAVANLPDPEREIPQVANIATVSGSIPQMNRTVTRRLSNPSGDVESVYGTSNLPQRFSSRYQPVAGVNPFYIHWEFTTSTPDPERRVPNVIILPDGSVWYRTDLPSSSEGPHTVGLEIPIPISGASDITPAHDRPASSAGGNGRKSKKATREPATTSRTKSQPRSKSAKRLKGI